MPIIKYTPKPPKFWADALNESEKRMLKSARQMEGLAEEIAVLRVKLRSAVIESPEDLRLLTHGIDMLVKAVALQYKLSPKPKKTSPTTSPTSSTPSATS